MEYLKMEINRSRDNWGFKWILKSQIALLFRIFLLKLKKDMFFYELL